MHHHSAEVQTGFGRQIHWACLAVMTGEFIAIPDATSTQERPNVTRGRAKYLKTEPMRVYFPLWREQPVPYKRPNEWTDQAKGNRQGEQQLIAGDPYFAPRGTTLCGNPVGSRLFGNFASGPALTVACLIIFRNSLSFRAFGGRELTHGLALIVA